MSKSIVLDINEFICGMIRLIPTIHGINWAVENSFYAKNHNKTLSYKFAYPGFGSIMLDQNRICNLINNYGWNIDFLFEDICVSATDLECYGIETLEKIFLLLFNLRDKFISLQRAINIARSFIGSGRTNYYIFKSSDFPVFSYLIPDIEYKSFNCADLIALECRADMGAPFDIFNIMRCEVKCDECPETDNGDECDDCGNSISKSVCFKH